MRYRPFGATYGMAVSAVSLRLEDRSRRSARAWRDLLEGAMGAGVNCFEISGDSDGLIGGLAEALALVERRLVFLSWNAPARSDLEHSARTLMDRLAVDHLDLVIAPDREGLEAARLMKQSRLARLIGYGGTEETADEAVTLPGLDAVVAPYSLMAGWKERNRLKAASARNMAVIAYDIWPEVLQEPRGPTLVPRGLFRRKAAKAAHDAYGFLRHTHGWSPEQICLAYALTEPAVTTARFDADDLERVLSLASVPERDLPTGVAAQIEMARFSAESG